MPMVLPAPAPGGQTTRLTPSLRATCQHGPGRRRRSPTARIPKNAAALGDGDAGGPRHVLVHHVVHAEGGAVGCDAQRLRELAEGGVGGGRVDLHGAAQEEVSVEISQSQIASVTVASAPPRP